MLLVSNVLKVKGSDIYTVEKDTTTIEALELMAEKKCWRSPGDG